MRNSISRDLKVRQYILKLQGTDSPYRLLHFYGIVLNV